MPPPPRSGQRQRQRQGQQAPPDPTSVNSRPVNSAATSSIGTDEAGSRSNHLKPPGNESTRPSDINSTPPPLPIPQPISNALQSAGLEGEEEDDEDDESSAASTEDDSSSDEEEEEEELENAAAMLPDQGAPIVTSPPRTSQIHSGGQRTFGPPPSQVQAQAQTQTRVQAALGGEGSGAGKERAGGDAVGVGQGLSEGEEESSSDEDGEEVDGRMDDGVKSKDLGGSVIVKPPAGVAEAGSAKGNGNENGNGNAKGVKPSGMKLEGRDADAEEDEEDAEEGDTMEGDETVEDDDDEEDEEEDEDEEEEEPSLKYSRLGPASTEILIKDTASALAASSRFIALGTHNGMVHILTYEGSKIKSYRPHGASVTDIKIDEEGEFVGTASVEGRVVIHSTTTPEIYAFDLHRPLRCIALEPNFAKKSTRAFVCGGMAGTLVMHEKGWLGHKEVVLHSGEGPIWAVEWRGSYIAWANDLGVKIYDTSSSQQITFIDRPANSPRADLFKPNLVWQDDRTLLIAWADYIKVARLRDRPRQSTISTSSGSNVVVEITAIFRVDCMISGICPYESASGSGSAFLVLAYVAPDTYDNEATDDPMEQRRKAANRPELRIISKNGEEVSSDALSLSNYHLYGCNDYLLVPSGRVRDELYLVVSPKDVVVSRPRDQVDHINWLVDQRKFAEALSAAEKVVKEHGQGLDVKAIGLKYIKHLFDEGSYDQAAELCPKVFGHDTKTWEDWVFTFVQRGQLSAIIPYIPTKSPRLSRLVYDMIMAHFLANDKDALLVRIREWPKEIYDVQAVTVAVKGELDSSASSAILMECLSELYVVQHQPAKALPYLIRLRQPRVFSFIQEHNLFSAVQDQVLLLVDFDQEQGGSKIDLNGDAEKQNHIEASPIMQEEKATLRHGRAIALLVDHTFSIPISRVVSQLESRPKYLHMYLDALFRKDPSLAFEYSDLQVRLYAEYDYTQLMGFLRASNYYSLEKAYAICKDRDFVPEMVFLLGRMGNNKQALSLIIERLGDVERAIEFAREQSDEDLWEDLLRYSENKPAFIRGLLENIGADINPLRIMRRIRDGLEIPGLKEALIKILQASNLQVSLLEGCQRILSSDASAFAAELQAGQTKGAFASGNSRCAVCNDYLFRPEQPEVAPLAMSYFCQHLLHATCALPDKSVELPQRPDPLANFLYIGNNERSGTGSLGTARAMAKNIGAKLASSATIRVRVGSCPVCRVEGERGMIGQGEEEREVVAVRSQ